MVYKFFKERQPKNDTSCPDEELLACFLEGKVSEEENQKIQEHILSCKRCAELLTIFSQEEKTLEVPDYLLDKVRKLVSKKEEPPLWLEALLMLKEKGLEIIKSGADILVGNEILPLPLLRSRQKEEIAEQIFL